MKRSILEHLVQLIRASEASAVGLAAHRLETGEEILIEPDRAFHPASTMKVCVMLEAYRQARIGAIALRDRVAVRNQFYSIADNSPYSLSPGDDSEKDLYDRIGEAAPLLELIELMITRSSNLATNMLMQYFRPQQVTAFMQQLGGDDLIVLRGVEDNRAYRRGLNNSASAGGFMRVLLKLAHRQVVSAEDSDEMINILARQQFNEMIPAQLPTGTRVAHKTGWTGDYYHDVGIVYPRAAPPFVLCIFTQGYAESSEPAAHELVASLAKSVYEHWKLPI